MNILRRMAPYGALAKRVSAEHGVSVLHQVSDILRLSRSPGRIGPGDYYVYRLFGNDLSEAEKQEFVGWKSESWLNELNEQSWHCLGLDKVLMYSLLQNNNIRIPDTRAIYLPGRVRPLGGAIALQTDSALHAWLRSPSNYPFFSKPSASGFGRGAFFAVGYDEATDFILFRDGHSIGVEDFAGTFHDIERLGYLFQTPVKPDNGLVSSLGSIVTSLRMVVLCDEYEGPILHRCLWKLPTGCNMNDNFNRGQTGNVIASIDQKTGQVLRVINGVELDSVDVEHHPDTGILLKSLCVPDWKGVLDFTFRAALTLPKLRYQQWDIALSNEGPLALEVNLSGTGGCDLTQVIYRKGLLDETMKSFLKRHSL